MINVCLFGCGRMGLSHAMHIEQNPFAKLAGVFDPDIANAKNVADQFNAKVYNSVEDALNEKAIDAVAIVSPTATHADLIIASAKAGKPIFCEKPIDLSLERIDQCLKVVKMCQVPLFVGFNRRFDPSFRALRNNIIENKIGPIEILNLSSRDAPFPDINYLRTSGGMFLDMTIHDFDMARWLLSDEPTEVYACGSCLVDKRIEEFNDIDTASITIKTKNGSICNINNSRRSAYGYDQRIEAFGPHGMLIAKNHTPTSVEHSSASGVKTDTILPSFPERYFEAYRLEINHFLEDIVKNGKKPEISGDDGRQALVIANSANESLQKGRPVKIPQPLG